MGNSTEIKNAILFNKVQVPHFNYVRFCIRIPVTYGAGCITSNVNRIKPWSGWITTVKELIRGLRNSGPYSVTVWKLAATPYLIRVIVGRNVNIYPPSMVGDVFRRAAYTKSRGNRGQTHGLTGYPIYELIMRNIGQHNIAKT